jgi:hypothetical protein
MNSFYDHIEQYLEGELPASEHAAFEAALLQDPQLQEAVEDHRAVIQEINGMRLRQTIKKNLQKPAPQGWADRRLWAVGALMLTGIVVLIWIRNLPEQGEVPANPTSTPGPTIETPIAVQDNQGISPSNTAPQTPPQPKSQDQAIDPKISLAYQEVVDQLENLDDALMGDAKKDAELEKQLNQAIALLKSDKSKAAIPVLEKVVSANNSFYQDDADWLLSLAWLVNDPAKSKTRLQAIAQNTAHSYRINAIRLLSKLK